MSSSAEGWLCVDYLVFVTCNELTGVFLKVCCADISVALCHEYCEHVCFILFRAMTRSSASYSFDVCILLHKVGQIIVTRQKSFLIRINDKNASFSIKAEMNDPWSYGTPTAPVPQKYIKCI